MPFDGTGLHLTPVQQLLFHAAAIVRERGLAKGIQQSETGQVCLHGALSIAEIGVPYSDGPLHCEASRLVAKYLIAQGADSVQFWDRSGLITGCAAWNNTKERTADDVVACLEAAAMFEVAAVK